MCGDQQRRVIAIAAIDRARAIAKDQRIPWYLPDDFKHFRRATQGHCVIMGRKTAESLPNGRSLPNRDNIVVTKQSHWQRKGFHVAHSLSSALAACSPEKISYIIGGATLYEQMLPCCDTMILTEVDHIFSGDVFFPAWSHEAWQLTESHFHPVDDRHPYAFTIRTYKRIRPDPATLQGEVPEAQL